MVVVTVAGLRRFVAKLADMPGESQIDMRLLGLRGGVTVEPADGSDHPLHVRFNLEDLPDE